MSVDSMRNWSRTKSLRSQLKSRSDKLRPRTESRNVQTEAAQTAKEQESEDKWSRGKMGSRGFAKGRAWEAEGHPGLPWWKQRCWTMETQSQTVPGAWTWNHHWHTKTFNAVQFSKHWWGIYSMPGAGCIPPRYKWLSPASSSSWWRPQGNSAVGLGSDAHSTQGCLLPSQGSLEWGTGKRISKTSGTWVPVMGPRSPLSQEGVLLTSYWPWQTSCSMTCSQIYGRGMLTLK